MIRNHKLMTGTILKIIPAENDSDRVTHLVVSTRDGRYKTVLGPGMYKVARAKQFRVGTRVQICMEPVPTMIGVVHDDEPTE